MVCLKVGFLCSQGEGPPCCYPCFAPHHLDCLAVACVHTSCVAQAHTVYATVLRPVSCPTPIPPAILPSHGCDVAGDFISLAFTRAVAPSTLPNGMYGFLTEAQVDSMFEFTPPLCLPPGPGGSALMGR